VKDAGIRTLLDLSEQVIDQEDGYWVKIEAWEVAPSDQVPHGIRYSLTLHAPSGKRILGYDNAHAVKVRRGWYSGQRGHSTTSIGTRRTAVCRMRSRTHTSCCRTSSPRSTQY